MSCDDCLQDLVSASLSAGPSFCFLAANLAGYLCKTMCGLVSSTVLVFFSFSFFSFSVSSIL